MGRTIRTAILALTLAAATAAGQACDIIYPENYVPPTVEQLVAGSFAFIGRVVGYRFDDGSILEHDITCSDVSRDDFLACWDQRLRIVNAILSVEAPIRGITQPLFEDTTSAEGGADCGNEFGEGGLYLITDYMGGEIVTAGHLATRLEALPSQEQLAAWRASPPPEDGK